MYSGETLCSVMRLENLLFQRVPDALSGFFQENTTNEGEGYRLKAWFLPSFPPPDAPLRDRAPASI